VIRLLIAVLPLAWVSRQVHWRDVFARAVHVGANWLALALLCAFATMLIGAMRWDLMLRAYDADPAKRPRLRTLFRHNLVGQYFAVLPTGVAGEAVRGYRVQDCFRDPTTSYLVLFIERLAGLLGLLAIAGAATLMSPSMRGDAVTWAMQVGMLIALVAGSVVFALPQIADRSATARKLIDALPIAGPILRRIPPARRIAPLLLALALSVVAQLGTLFTIYALIAPLASAATVFACARAVPAIVLITYIPLTPGGLGQREAAFKHFFGIVGVESDAAVAASLLFFGVFLTCSLAGGAVLLWERTRKLA
jgi:uncharacterized membrane protein YbhN (UPF0104 family)